jgi:hypothetical protein
MATTAHYSPATLARAAAGHQLPSREVVAAYAAACGGDREEWDQRWRACAEQVAQARADAPPGDSASVTGKTDLPPTADGQERFDDGPARPALRHAASRAMAPAAALVLVAVAVLLGVALRAPGPASPVRERGPAAAATSQQPLGRACAPTGIIAPKPAVSAPRPGRARVRVTFEGRFDTNRNGWGPWWGIQNLAENITAGSAFQGTQSLEAGVTQGSAAIGTTHLQGLRPGGVVTVHIRYDGQGEGRICPFIQTQQGTIEWIAQPDLELTASDWPGWRTISWRVPDLEIKGTGIQLNDTGASDFVIHLDSVSW